jgi:hypothetical protein
VNFPPLAVVKLIEPRRMNLISRLRNKRSIAPPQPAISSLDIPLDSDPPRPMDDASRPDWFRAPQFDHNACSEIDYCTEVKADIRKHSIRGLADLCALPLPR